MAKLKPVKRGKFKDTFEDIIASVEYKEPYNEPKPLEFLTQSQLDYFHSIQQNIISFGIGVAGTGKSFIPIAYAAEQLQKKKVKKIVFVRPAVECGKGYGFLPGELHEKIEPFYQPIKDILYERLGRSQTDYYIKRNIIEFRPLEFMRGSTFHDSIIILDESQNISANSFKMFLTRIGDNSKVIITGDTNQVDIKEKSGLQDAVDRLKSIRKVGITEFTIDDCVRSGICKDILIAYSI